MAEKKETKKVIKKFVVDRETAESDFERWAEAMDLELELAGLDENEARDTEVDKQRIITRIMKGHIQVTSDDWLVFTPQRAPRSGDELEDIVWKEPYGSTYLVMDKKKKSADIGKFYASLGETCKQPAVTFSRMAMADLKVCMSVYSLLMV